MMTLSSQPTLMPSRTESNGNCAGAEERAELAERKHTTVQESAGKDQSRNADKRQEARLPAIP